MAEQGNRDKELRFARAMAEARGFGLEVREVDWDRPWGGFIRFSRGSLGAFLSAYWRGTHVRDADLDLDAKLLLVAPGCRLSLQSHARRKEMWRVLEGPVLVVMGDSSECVSETWHRPTEVIEIECGKVHRLAAPAESWGLVAEFWQHIDPTTPSDESDVVRYDDDYGRPANG